MLDFKMIGLAVLLKKLQKETIKTPLAEGIKKVTLFLEREVKKATPVQTGRLWSSIVSHTTPYFGTVGTNVYYAPFVEYGTRKMEPRYIMGGMRVFGLGMFGHAIRVWQSKAKDFIGGIGKAIEVKFG